MIQPIHHLQIELSSYCNLKCNMCIRNEIEYFRHGSFNNIDQAILKNFFQSCKRDNIKFLSVDPLWVGESMLHPKFFNILEDMFQENSDNKLFDAFFLVTNGCFMDSKASEKLLNLAMKRHQRADTIRRVQFSLDSASRDSFLKIKKVDAYQQIVSNILGFLDIRTNLRLEFPKICISFIILPENYHEVNFFIDFWKNEFSSRGLSLPVMSEITTDITDSLIIKRAFTIKPDDNLQHEKRFNEIMAVQFKTKNEENYPSQGQICNAPFKTPIIGADGNVIPCCYDTNGNMAMGNIANSSFKDVWMGKKYAQLRFAHLTKNFSPFPICAKCPGMWYGHKLTSEEIRYWDKVNLHE